MKKKIIFLGIFYCVIGVILLILGLSLFKKCGHLEIRIKTRPAVMPMAYKVYGNRDVEDGRYYLAKLVFKNTGDGKIKNLEISYRVPDYIDWTTPNEYKEILPGQTVVDLFYPKFPSKILEVLNVTPATVEIKIKYNDGKKDIKEIRRADFQIRGRNELLYTDMPEEEISDIRDLFTNVDLCACFVTPEDPVIKYFTQQLQKNVMKGAGVGGSQQEILRFMQALYEFEIASGLVYGGTLGLPEKVGDHYTMVQHVRLPREVLTGGAGLCIELSLLFCSVAQSAGLNSGIFCTSKHAFPAIIANGNIIPIEATGIGGEGIGGRMDFKKAVELGMKEAQMFFAGGSPEIGVAIKFIPIGQMQAQGLRPPDLKDSPELKKKIDEMFAKLGTGGVQNRVTRVARTYNNNQNYGGRGNYSQPNFRRYNDPSGVYSFSYPAGWQILMSPNPYLPSLKVIAANPSMSRDVEVYLFPGVSDINYAFSTIYNTLIQMGTQIQYQPAGTVTINGRQYARFAGMSVSNMGTVYWAGYFTTTSAGVVGFVIGSTSNALNSPDLVTIKNSFRVMR